ncbi:hypothetical protein BTO20_30305 [Mycobacterium dioxanotrophicus]|uniref:Uncharacterized protein n=1 Tax=Mycobacterium dioxanotrophicus TaxID=482462 RepID=A0A1Y0CB28_9MYCO|nr:hypothetical protein [Mycobacterium dioxanotrophicus]ART72277.1 hypothetical protein BTO20_30305 [Mycobacterium dioxanotrophicus]
MPVNPTTVTSLQSGEVTTVVPIVTTMAKAYTRGRGFTGNEPNDEIAAVIATASARLAANGTGLQSKKVDDVEYQYSLASSFGWTLAEQIVLNRYRVRAQ